MIDKAFLKEYLLKPACFAIVIVAVLFLLNKFTYFNFSIGSNQNYNSFEVIGTGKVTAVPNVAQTTFSISEKAATQDAAKDVANKKQNEAISELQKLGIKKADIKTTGFYVNQNYEDVIILETGRSQPPASQAYIANVTTTVKADSIETLNKAIDTLTAIGINVGGVEYTLDDQEKYQMEAQDKAIANAKEQALNIAKAAGFKLGKIVSIRNADDQYGYPQPYAAESAMNMKAPASPDTNLEPGSNEITSRMGVTYYIKN